MLRLTAAAILLQTLFFKSTGAVPRLPFKGLGQSQGNFTLTSSASMPKPASLLLAGLGLVGLAAQMRRRSGSSRR